jgi:hypothetical protein
MSTKTIYTETEDTEKPSCTSTVYQTETVCVPVTVKPFATPGTTKTVCCGEPVISSGNQCGDDSQNFCTFTITQAVCIEVPVAFGAEIETGTPAVQCGIADTEECSCMKD